MVPFELSVLAAAPNLTSSKHADAWVRVLHHSTITQMQCHAAEVGQPLLGHLSTYAKSQIHSDFFSSENDVYTCTRVKKCARCGNPAACTEGLSKKTN